VRAGLPGAGHERSQLRDLILEGLAGSRGERFPCEHSRLVRGHVHGCRADVEERHLTWAVQHSPHLGDDRCFPRAQPGSDAGGNPPVGGDVDEAPHDRDDAEQLTRPAERVHLGRVHGREDMRHCAYRATVRAPGRNAR
jgi:hypothetical protein